jgi:methylmalonyl-CoA mutase
MRSAVEEGSIGGRLAGALTERRQAIADRRDPVTGVSSWAMPNELPIERPAPDHATLREDAAERVAARPAEERAAAELERLTAAVTTAAGDGSVMAAAVEACAAEATVCQLADALRGSDHRTRIVPLPAEREAAAFEELRDAADALLAATGRRPRAFVVGIGPIAENRSRFDLVRDLLAAGGIETVAGEEFDRPAAAVAAFASSGARLAVICASEERLAEVLPALARGLEEEGAKKVLVAGRPGDRESEWRQTGIDGFISSGCDAVSLLRELLEAEAARDD